MSAQTEPLHVDQASDLTGTSLLLILFLQTSSPWQQIIAWNTKFSSIQWSEHCCCRWFDPHNRSGIELVYVWLKPVPWGHVMFFLNHIFMPFLSRNHSPACWRQEVRLIVFFIFTKFSPGRRLKRTTVQGCIIWLTSAEEEAVASCLTAYGGCEGQFSSISD